MSSESDVRSARRPIRGDPRAGLLATIVHALYDAAWIAAIVVASPWWAIRALFDSRFRAMLLARSALRVPIEVRPAKPRVLVHGVSVGEVKCAAPLVRAIADAHPELELVISTTTATGFEVATKLFPELAVVRYPIDARFSVARFLRRVAPSVVVLVELEIWPNFLRACNQRDVPVAVVNGRITPRTVERWSKLRGALPEFERVSLFCAAAEEYAERFRRLGAASERVVVTGNMKADGLRLGALEPNVELKRALGVREGALTIVAGSTHAPEERWVVEAWREGAPNARLVLVPRHPPRAAEVASELAALGVAPQLLTRLRGGGEAPDPSRPVIVDTIGELEAVYALADLVYVGGSLIERGGQNVLEPAARGRAVLHGPHVDNFREEAALLAKAGASRCVRDPNELASAFRQLTADGELRERMGSAGLAVVGAQKGATKLTLESLSSRCFPPDSSAHLADSKDASMLGLDSL